MDLPVQLTITDRTQQRWSFNTLESFENFIKSQVIFWLSIQDIASQNPTANQYIQRANNFQTMLNTIESWRPQLESWDSNTLITNFNNLINNQIGSSWLWSAHAFVKKWLELNEVSAMIADAFFEATVEKTTSRSRSDFDYMQGYVIAYEYQNQGKSNINTRKSSERKSLEHLRAELSKKQIELIDQVNTYQTEITDWKNKTKSDFSEWHDQQITHLEDTVLAHSKNFHDQLANWVNAHAELENKFREKLRFDGAATYWGSKADEFRLQGFRWGSALVITLVIGIAIFSKYFLAWLGGQPSGLGLQSIEGILLFATILSSYAFLIKSLSKLTFSSFHLQRDAEERQQLTHLYLALRDGANEDSESRKIILQSLFSRSESGLLSKEHGPTMPVITDYLNRVGK